jgi:hypothetical protein
MDGVVCLGWQAMENSRERARTRWKDKPGLSYVCCYTLSQCIVILRQRLPLKESMREYSLGFSIQTAH